MGIFEHRLTGMVGIALILVALGLVAGRAAAQPPPVAPVADPAALTGSGITTNPGYADRVIADMQARIGTNPTDDNALAQLGLAYLQKARETSDPTYYAQAETALQHALTLNPQSYSATGGLGALAASRHQFQDALQWGQKARALAPYSAYAFGVIGDAQVELGDYDAAVGTFQQMVDLRPDISSYSRVSYVRELYGDVPGAIAAMQQAATAGGPAPENAAWTHWQLGGLYFNSGRLADAEREYNAALAVFPGYIHAEAGLGAVRAAQGRFPEAIALYQQAIAGVPLPQYVQALGDVYAASGDSAAAQQQYDLVLYIFHVFEVNGVDVNMEKAAFLADRNQDAASAVQLAQQAATWRHDVHTDDALAWALYRAGRAAEALTAENQALRLGMRNALFYFHRGMIERALDQTTAARADLQTALAINPYFSLTYAPQATALLQGEGK